MTDYITAKERIGTSKKEVTIIEELLLALITVAIIAYSIYALTY